MAEISTETANRNEVRIAGQVVNMFQMTDKNITNTTIAVTTGAKRNNPKITWYGDKAKKIADALKGKNKPCITITGYIQTSRTIRNGKPEYHQNIVGKAFTVESAPKAENVVTITGELTRKYNLTNSNTGEIKGTEIRVKTIEKKLNYPEITLFGEQSAAVQDIEPGSILSVIGTVQTDKTQTRQTVNLCTARA